MEIDLGPEIVIKVKVGDKSYELREPRISDVEKMSDTDQNDMKAANLALQDFITGLGMPREAVESLGVMKLKTLAEGLTSSLSEKK